jgi:hypothetical protein
MLLFGKQLVCCHENTQKSVTLVWSKMHRVFSLLVAQLWPWKRLDMILLRKCSFSFDKNHASCIANCASHSVYDGELPSSETYLFKIPHLLYDLVHVLYKLLNCLRRMDSLTLHDSSGGTPGMRMRMLVISNTRLGTTLPTMTLVGYSMICSKVYVT